MNKLRMLVVGDYDPSYIRNDVLLTGLKREGAQVYECRTNRKGVSRLYELWRLCRRSSYTYDVMFIPSSDTSRAVVFLCRMLSRKPIIWDAYYSLYDSWVFDRRLVNRFSLKALYYWVLEYVDCRFADIILLDTQEHINFFKKTFLLQDNKFLKVLVGANQDKLYESLIAHPEIQNNIADTFRDKKVVYFQGKFIPLQGVEYIVDAARRLQHRTDIVFLVVGKGQTYNNIRDLVHKKNITNIHFVGRVPYSHLASYIRSADVCLGIFGNTDKAMRVIPSKVYEYTALGAPVITSDTPAIRELFSEHDLFLCKRADGADLAQTIVYALDHGDIRTTKGRHGQRVFTMNAHIDIIAKQLIQDIIHKIYDR